MMSGESSCLSEQHVRLAGLVEKSESGQTVWPNLLRAGALPVTPVLHESVNTGLARPSSSPYSPPFKRGSVPRSQRDPRIMLQRFPR
jgi:hypothetical protein